MRYIGIGIILIYMLLAIMSRKYFSKYKDKSIFYSIAAMIFGWLKLENIKSKLSGYIKKTHTLNSMGIKKLTDEYLIKLISKIIAFLFVLVMISTVVLFLPEVEKGEKNEILRDGYGGNSNTYKIYISEGENKEKYEMTVYPQEYTYEEFLMAADQSYEYLTKAILGENASFENITKDMVFPTANQDETLNIDWYSDSSTIMSNKGHINHEELKGYAEVNIEARIYDENYEKKYKWKLKVVEDASSIDAKKAVTNKLKEIEKENRNSKQFIMPEKIDNMKIEVETKSKENKVCEIFCLGIVIAAIFTAFAVNRLKEKGKKRDEEIGNHYFRFLNKLILMSRAGANVRVILRQMLKESEDGDVLGTYLNAEIRRFLNELDSGVSDSKACANLGNSIGLPEYIKLMSLIAQNVNRGNSNLLLLLENEGKTALIMKKEKARKKGEEASSKLLLPMFLLLVVVIAIVIYPAITGF